MWHFVIRYLSPLIPAVAPLVVGSYSLLDLVGAWPTGAQRASVLWFSEGPKDEIEMRVRVLLTLTGYALFVFSGYIDLYRPARSLVKFRGDLIAFLNECHWRHGGLNISSDIRINVMYIRWRLRRPFGWSFEVAWRDGFQPKHRDADIRLYAWQGACGRARSRRDAVFVDFRTMVPPTNLRWWHWSPDFRLTKWQQDKTAHLYAILSVPIFDTSGPPGQEKQKCVGVINLDALTPAAADALKTRADDLSKALAQHGTLIAKVR